MRVICVARHPFLSRHLAHVFSCAADRCTPVVGLEAGMLLAREMHPDVALCEVDLLTDALLREWEADPVLRDVPLLAVSLTRRHNEVPSLAGTAINGFLYMPTLTDDEARRALAAVAGGSVRAPRRSLLWPAEREQLRAP